MPSFWLERILLEEVAETLCEYLNNALNKIITNDPQTLIDKKTKQFFLGHPHWLKYSKDIEVEGKIKQYNNNTYRFLSVTTSIPDLV